MTRISIFFVLLVCLFVPGVSIAGSAGGIFLFIIPMESNLSEKIVIDNYFKKTMESIMHYHQHVRLHITIKLSTLGQWLMFSI